MDAPAEDLGSPQKGINPVLLIAVVVLLVFVAGLAYVWFTSGSLNLLSFTKPKATPQPTTKVDLDREIKAPVRLSHPAISSVSIVYTFSTRIAQITSDPKGLIVMTPINGIDQDGIPEKFVVTKDTIVYFTDGKNKSDGASSDLKIGQNVKVLASYNINTKKWKTSRIGIVSHPEL